MNVNIFVTKEYEESSRLRARKNKAKQSQFHVAGSDSAVGFPQNMALLVRLRPYILRLMLFSIQ